MFIKYRFLFLYLISNNTKSVIVVDNIKMNYNIRLITIFKEFKVTLTYLSSYSPNLNLIEILFAVLKV